MYLPTLESKSEIKHNILKFTNQINNALTQAYGNVTIYVPPITASDDEIAINPKILKSFQDAVVSAHSNNCALYGGDTVKPPALTLITKARRVCGLAGTFEFPGDVPVSPAGNFN